MNRGDVKDTIRSYLADSFLSEARAAALRDDEDLLALLDSLQVLRTVIHLEGAFGIKFEDAGQLRSACAGWLHSCAEGA